MTTFEVGAIVLRAAMHVESHSMLQSVTEGIDVSERSETSP